MQFNVSHFILFFPNKLSAQLLDRQDHLRYVFDKHIYVHSVRSARDRANQSMEERRRGEASVDSTDFYLQIINYRY